MEEIRDAGGLEQRESKAINSKEENCRGEASGGESVEKGVLTGVGWVKNSKRLNTKKIPFHLTNWKR